VQRRARFGAALAAAALLAGCGAGATRSAHPTPQFAAIANSICAHANSDITALPTPAATLRSLALAARRELPIERLELVQLAALTAPRAQERRFAAALAVARREIELIARLIGAIRDGNIGTVKVLALRGRALAASTQTSMTTLGLSACAREAEPHGAH
jgi:hypothetical protein